MGFLGPIPANKLAAVYNTATHELILSASGEVREFATGFHFTRKSLMGGLEFSLMAWSGPIGQKMQPYSFQQSFPITLPSRVFPSGTVTIITSNHPHGLVVPIHFTGLQPHEQSAQYAAAPAPAPATSPVSADAVAATGIIPGQTRLNVLFKTQFNIRASAHVPAMGSVNISFDKKYVQLVNTSIQGNDIVWTFFANEMGNTPVTVTTSGGIATYEIVHTYDVFIFVL
jgi:hypothetical protein